MKKLIPSLCIAVVLIVTACSPKKDLTVIAEGKGFQITQAELNDAIEKMLPPNVQLPEEQRKQMEALVLNQLIHRKLIASAAESLSQDEINQAVDKRLEEIKSRFPDEKAFLEKLKEDNVKLADFKENLRSAIVTEKIVEQNITEETAEVTDDELEKFYEENPEIWERPESIKARHILVFVRPNMTPEEKKAQRAKIDKARQRIVDGEPFAKVAEDVSEDFATKNAGGMLPSFERENQLAPQFTEQVFKQEAGKLGPVFETQYGFHLAKVEEKEPARTISFAETKENLREMLSEQKRMSGVRDYFQKLWEEADVKIHLPHLKQAAMPSPAQAGAPVPPPPAEQPQS